MIRAAFTAASGQSCRRAQCPPGRCLHLSPVAPPGFQDPYLSFIGPMHDKDRGTQEGIKSTTRDLAFQRSPDVVLVGIEPNLFVPPIRIAVAQYRSADSSAQKIRRRRPIVAPAARVQ